MTVHSSAADLLFTALRDAGGDVLLASPYLTRDIARRLAAIAETSAHDWLLVTRLDAPAVANGYLSVEGLGVLLGVGVRIVDCARLHAKAYLVGDGFGLVGSANLTGSGLGTTTATNLELSVRLDPAEVPGVRNKLLAWAGGGKNVDSVRLEALAAEAAALPKAKPAPPTGTAAVAPTTADVEQLLADARDRRLWAKGHYGDPHPDEWRAESWFSSSKKARPTFAVSDLVLVYSVDAPGVYAVVEIIDEAVHDPEFVTAQTGSEEEGERWPYVNRTTPRLVPDDLALVTAEQLGFSGRGLQNGHKKLSLSEFAAAVRALADGL
ncbi:phospholipase D-like domain-containing protein [Gordonia westfalica]|uniref:phospholipase D-like domain-containing protein n=1 Tax=Gordonia westfalica TaxID=158898 RepID=UPI000945DF21|nr:phospholipase D-like domain-containing protein [Gordonia westfalica]